MKSYLCSINKIINMKTKSKIPRDISEGKLVFACVRKYRGTGRRRLILHEATIIGRRKSFSYGSGKVWTAGISQLKAVR